MAAAKAPSLECRNCFHNGEPWLVWQEFTNGTIHLRAECQVCGRYIQYVPQVTPWTDAIATFDMTSVQ